MSFSLLYLKKKMVEKYKFKSQKTIEFLINLKTVDNNSWYSTRYILFNAYNLFSVDYEKSTVRLLYVNTKYSFK